jgi:uncharacterized membrane protein YccC
MFNLTPQVAIGLALAGFAVWWIYQDYRSRKPHGRIVDLIDEVKSEAAKKSLREAGKALYDDEAKP